MRAISIALCLAALSVLLSGCSPGLSIQLYNGTGETITVTTDTLRRSLPIPARTAAEIPAAGPRGERLIIRTSKARWIYNLDDLNVPSGFWQEKFMRMRAFAKIDSRGEIYLLAPPSGREDSRETRQPAGFPMKPRKT